jgi:hypothetical protein
MCCTSADLCDQEDAPILAGEEPLGEQQELDAILCKGSTDPDCAPCVQGGGVYTALGCFAGDATDFTGIILKFAVGIAGAVAFLMLVYGAFLYVVSAGDPKALENAKGTISGALTGLLFIIFAVVILNMIGYQILQLPGF